MVKLITKNNYSGGKNVFNMQMQNENEGICKICKELNRQLRFSSHYFRVGGNWCTFESQNGEFS